MSQKRRVLKIVENFKTKNPSVCVVLGFALQPPSAEEIEKFGVDRAAMLLYRCQQAGATGKVIVFDF